MLRIAVACVLAALALCCAQSGRAVPALPEIRTSGFAPRVRAEVEKAMALARSRPDDVKAAGHLAMLLDAHEQYEVASVAYRRAAHLDPAAFEWPYLLGCARAAQGRQDEAAKAFETSLLLRDSTVTRLQLADAWLRLGRHDDAARLYSALVEADDGNATAWYGLGRTAEAKDDAARAIECYTKACARFPAYSAAHYALGMALRRQGRTGDAESHLTISEQNKTKSPPLADPLRDAVRDLAGGANVHLRRAAALEQQGRLQDAVAEHLQALAVDPNSVQAYINLISLYGRLGQPREAEEHYAAAIALDPGQADAYYNLGVLRFGQGRQRDAERAFREALVRNPNHAPARNNLGFIYERQGRGAAALQEYEQAIASQPDYRLAHFHAGRILAGQRRYPPAIEHFLKAIAVDDEATPGYLYALAATYARAGRMGQAIDTARRARDAASKRGQSELLASIERDLRVMEQRGGSR
jgi:tetratricopeptide (TPR) repeat protein